VPQNLLHAKKIRDLIIDKASNHGCPVRPGVWPVMRRVKPYVESHHIDGGIISRNTREAKNCNKGSYSK